MTLRVTMENFAEFSDEDYLYDDCEDVGVSAGTDVVMPEVVAEPATNAGVGQPTKELTIVKGDTHALSKLNPRKPFDVWGLPSNIDSSGEILALCPHARRHGSSYIVHSVGTAKGDDGKPIGPIYSVTAYIEGKKNFYRKQQTLLHVPEQEMLLDLTYCAGGARQNVTKAHLEIVLSAIMGDEKRKLRYDTVSREIFLGDKRYNLDDIDLLAIQLSGQFGINFPGNIHRSLLAIAKRKPFNRFREMFDGIAAKNEPLPLEGLAKDIFEIKGRRAQLAMKLQVIATVIRSGGYLNPRGEELYWRMMLVLIGAQSIGKDAGIDMLFHDEATVAPRTGKLDDVQLAKVLNENMVCRFDEVKRYVANPVALETIKSWMCKKKLEFIDKYQKSKETETRRFTCWGSSNDQKWLTDPTGAMRYWNLEMPHEEGRAMKLKELRETRDRYLADAVRYAKMWEQGEYDPWGPEMDELELLNREVAHRYKSLGPVHDSLLKFIDDSWKCITYDQLSTITGLRRDELRSNSTHYPEIQMAMSELGFSKDTVRTYFSGYSSKPSVWKRPDCGALDYQEDYKRVPRLITGQGDAEPDEDLGDY